MVQFGCQLVDGVPQCLHLEGESLLRVVSAQLHVRPRGSVLQPRLRQLQRVLLGLDGGLHVADVALLVSDLAASLENIVVKHSQH